MPAKRKTKTVKKKRLNTGHYIGLSRKNNVESNKFLVAVMKGASKLFNK